MTPAVLSVCDAATGIGSIVFNRPDVLNAIDLELARGLAEAIARMGDWQGLRCLVLSGAGRAFMAGGDLSHFAGPVDVTRSYLDDLLGVLVPALLRLRDLDAPILAAVHGAVAGAGLSLALNADLILAAGDSRFMLAYDRIGAIPDCGGSWLLPRRIGAGRAAEMMLLSRSLTAAEASDWGLVNAVAPEADFAAQTLTLATRLAQGPSRAHGAFRRLSDSAMAAPFAEHLEAEWKAFVQMAQTPDFAEGVDAFLSRRATRFTGS